MLFKIWLKKLAVFAFGPYGQGKKIISFEPNQAKVTLLSNALSIFLSWPVVYQWESPTAK